jgi:glutamate 5-kinase
MFERNPRLDPDAKLISEWLAGDPALERMASGEAGRLGRGGMLTKVRAAARAAGSGAATVIASGRHPNVLQCIADGEAIGTLLLPHQEPLAARKRWLAGQLQVRGRLRLDAGAAQVLRAAGRSLLAVGVTGVEGDFTRGELVACIDDQGREIARGLTNYSAAEARKIRGQPSTKIEEILGYVDEPELIHRDNLVLL